MRKNLNCKGMTLLEIIVVLLASSIIMMIVGSMILNSMGLFKREAVNDNIKYSVDTIASFTRDKLLYATNIKITSDNPGIGWQWIGVDADGHVFLDEEPLWAEDFYSGHKLKLSARVYDSNRIDLIFTFEDDKGNQVYKTTSTIDLVNIDGITVTEGDEVKNSGLGTEIVEITEKTGYRINFMLSVRDITDAADPVNPPGLTETTVKDEEKCRTDTITIPGAVGNNKGKFVLGSMYYKGDFVIYENQIYRAMIDITKSETNPDTSGIYDWKKISEYYNKNSYYTKNDIIIYNKKYYQLQDKDGAKGSAAGPLEADGWSEGFEYLDDLKKSSRYVKPIYSSCKIEYVNCSGTISDKIFDLRSSNFKGVFQTTGDLNNLKTAESNKIKKGDFVKFNKRYNEITKKWEVGDGQWYWYTALDDKAGDYIPGALASNEHWQCLGSIQTVGYGYNANFDTVNRYFTKNYYKGSTGDIIFSTKLNKYFEANATSGALYTTNSPDDLDASTLTSFWTEVSLAKINENKSNCELELNKIKAK